MANIKENKKYHFTYKTTNLINGRYYLGMHSTNRLDDGYLGSGKRLYYEISKYGRDNFKLEILKYFNTREELVEAEKILIREQDIDSQNCLNIRPGGSGGFSKEIREKGKIAARAYMKEKWKNQDFRKHITEAVRKQRNKEVDEGTYTVPNKGHWKGKKHKPETIEKMKQSHKGAGKGSNNSQFGKCWITNEVENKKIYKGELIPEGWRLGRKLN
jgi:hypothetical protein